ncbi:hypothetical protein [Marinobacterium sp. BA1]|uniref:hypothetical protein n=1 Tax=Marinobacterium sp. BA1 TaxID=3138931 RepID=UPI0032E7EF14
MSNIEPKELYCAPCIGAGLALLLNSTPANAPNDCDPVEEHTGFDAFFDSASIIIPPAKVAKGPVKEIIEEIVQSAARPARCRRIYRRSDIPGKI